VQSKTSYQNPYAAPHTVAFTSTAPALVRFFPPELQISPGAKGLVGLVFDGAALAQDGPQAAAAGSTLQVLVFVHDQQQRAEECFAIRVTVLGA